MDQTYTYDQTSAFSFLENIPDEDPTFFVQDHDFIRKPLTHHRHAGHVQRTKNESTLFNDSIMVPLDNKVPVAIDLPGNTMHTNNPGHLTNVWKNHDFGPLLPIRVDNESEKRNHYMDVQPDSNINMMGFVSNKDQTTGPGARDLLQAEDDYEKPMRGYNDNMYSVEHKGESKSTIMVTGAREVEMPMHMGGPMTTRAQHRMEQDVSGRTDMHMETAMGFRPHMNLVQSNEMHRMTGHMERPDNNYAVLDMDMYATFQPRNQHDLHDTYHKGQTLEVPYHVDEPDEWM
jgi:hypothetical protein